MARILVIDDEEPVRAAVAHVLRRAGHEVRVAGDGEEGMREYEAGRFDLVITDLIMPRMEGIETVLAIRRVQRPVKILAISGCARSGAAFYLTAATALGADGSLIKPFTPAELRCAVAGLLGG